MGILKGHLGVLQCRRIGAYPCGSHGSGVAEPAALRASGPCGAKLRTPSNWSPMDIRLVSRTVSIPMALRTRRSSTIFREKLGLRVLQIPGTTRLSKNAKWGIAQHHRIGEFRIITLKKSLIRSACVGIVVLRLVADEVRARGQDSRKSVIWARYELWASGFRASTQINADSTSVPA